MKQDINELVRILAEVFECFELSREQCAKALGRSISTIDRMRKKGIGPKFKKNEESVNGTVKYPIHEVAKYIFSKNLKTIDGDKGDKYEL